MTIENPIKISIKQNNIITTEGNITSFTVSLNQISNQTIKLAYYLDNSLSDVFITDQDFKDSQAPNGILEFKAGEISKTIEIPLASDNLTESLEKFVIQFLSLSPNTILETSTIAEFINDNTVINTPKKVTIQTLNTGDLFEGDTLTLKLTLDQKSDAPISVDYVIRPQTTSLTQDDFSNYSQKGVITFESGKTEQTFSLHSVIDSLEENDESFIIDFIPNDSFVTIPQASQSIKTTLKNKNANVISRFSLDKVNVSQIEGKSFDFKLKLDQANTQDIVVKYNIKYITDTLTNSDFQILNTTGFVTFKAGQTEQTLSVSTKDDLLIESDEIFKVEFSSDSNALLFNESSAYGVILNNDSSSNIISQLSVMPEMVTQAEGQLYKYIINLDRPNTHDISIQYKINAISSDLTASDFGSADLFGTITFKAGEQQKVIEITPIIDTQIEENEAFSLDLSSDSPFVSLKSSSSISTIQDSNSIVSKPKVTALIQDENVAEGNPFVYNFTLDKAYDSDVTINYAVEATNKNVTASDFGSILPMGSIVIPAGETSKTLSISTVSDTAIGESDESFYLMLWSTQSTIEPTTSIKSTILNSASPIEISKLNLSVDHNQVIEGNDITYTLQLDKGNAREITLNYKVVGISPNLNVEDFDNKLPNGTITFAPNEVKKSLSISPIIDNINETNGEVFILQLSSTSPYLSFENSILETTILDQNAITGISNVTFEKISLTQVEGVPFQFDVNLSQPQTETVSMTYDVIPISKNLTSDDFENNQFPSGIIAFKAGETQKSIQINTLNDGIDESTEYFSLKLHTNSPSLSLLNSSSVGTLLNNTNPPALTISANSSNIKEGNAFNYNLKLDRVSSEDITVTYNIKSITNTLTSSDFENTELTGSVLIKAGTIEKNLILSTVLDNIKESNEEFNIEFESNSNVILNTKSITSIIQNSDDLPIRSRLNIATDSIFQLESNALNYTLSLDKANNQTILVHYQVTPISDELTELDFEDNQFPSGTIIFNPNETSKSLTIRPLNDLITEENEAFVIHLTSKSPVLDFDSSVITGIIANDDLNPTYSKLSVTTDKTVVKEGDIVSYILSLDKAQSQDITIGYAVQSDLLTLDADDFNSKNLPTGLITFKAGETQKRLNLPIQLDDKLENTEYFTLKFTNESSLISLETSAITTKIEDVYRPVLTLTTSKEKLSEGTDFEYTLKFDKALSEDVTINYHIEAISPYLTADDFNLSKLPHGSITFKAGETIKQLAITSVIDNLNESNELFKLIVDSDSSAFEFYNQSITSTLINTSPAVVSILTISPQSNVNKEGEEIRYTLKLNQANSNPIDVNYQLVPNTDNLNESDFVDGVIPSGTIHFDAGQTEQSLILNTLRDLIKESDEYYHIELTSRSPYVLLSNIDVLGSIQDNNKSLIEHSSNLNKTEGNNFKYTLKLDQANDLPFTVHYEVQPISESLNAIDFVDKKLPKGDITFKTGEISKSFTINTLNDLISEVDERFVVNLSITSNNDNVILNDSKIYGTILNDDVQIAQLSVSSSTNIVYEGNAFEYQLNLDEANLNPVIIRYAISTENISNPLFSVSDNNFASFKKTGLITFNAGETSKTISLPTINDDFTNYDLLTSNHSANRYFNLKLTPVSTNVSVNAQSIQSILLDDDAFTPITLSQSNVTASNNGITQITRLSSESIDDYVSDATMNKIDISENNQYVVYATMDNNLLKDDQSPFADIVRFNLNSKAYQRVMNNAIEPSISADGNKILFTSYNNLLDNQVFQDTNGLGDVFLKDMTTNSTQLISIINGKTNSTNIQGDDESYSGTLSRSGDFVTFLSKATTLAKDNTNEVNLFAKNLKTNELKQINMNNLLTVDESLNYAKTQLNTMSSNGYFVFASSDNSLIKNDINQVADIFMQNIKTGEITLITTGSNDESSMPTMSNDGRFVVFSSKATNLISNDMNGSTLDIFVKDTQTNQVAIVSTKSNGIQGDKASIFPTISNDGHYIAFSSQNDLINDAQEGGRYITVNPLWEDITLNGVILNNIVA